MPISQDESELPLETSQIENGAPAEIASAPAADSAVGSLFRRVCVSSVKSVIGILNQITETFCRAAELDDKFTAKLIAKAEPEPDALNEFTESLDLVLKKHNVQPKNAEEIALCVSGARLLAPYAMIVVELRAEIRRLREKEKKS